MDIGSLLRGDVVSFPIDQEFIIPADIYKNSDILDLKPVYVKGSLKYIDPTFLELEATVSSTMILADSLTLEPVSYPFSFSILENVIEKVKNEQNILDIISILWENIVLEIPLRFSKVENYANLKGDGWQVITEEEN